MNDQCRQKLIKYKLQQYEILSSYIYIYNIYFVTIITWEEGT